MSDDDVVVKKKMNDKLLMAVGLIGLVAFIVLIVSMVTSMYQIFNFIYTGKETLNLKPIEIYEYISIITYVICGFIWRRNYTGDLIKENKKEQ